ncbi:cache domain-containing protein, partial [Aminipila sp.]|uniref:cache domain-containing protein n=1 Tax=Aminipila sp. TaxID=2060095 RepID=UPI0028A0E98E
MKVFKRSILLKFLIGVIIPVIICLCILLVSIFSLVKSQIEESTAETLTANSRQASFQVGEFFIQYQKIAETLASNPDIQKLFKEVGKGTLITSPEVFADVKANLINAQAMDSENILSAWVADIDSSQLTQSDGYTSGADWDVTKRSWFIEVNQKNGFVLTQPYEDTVTKKLIVTAVCPVYDSVSNEIIGAIGIDIALDNLEKIMASYTLGDTGFFIFLSGAGDVVYEKNTDNIMKNVKEIGLSEEFITVFDKKAEGYLAYNKDGKEAYGYYSFIGETGWSVLSSLPQEEFYQGYRVLREVSLGILVAALVILSLVIV